VQDTTPPVIILTGDNPLTLEAGFDIYTEPGATASDVANPDVSVVIGGDVVDSTTVGVYVVTYEATDDSGNSALETRTVNVIDTTPPETVIGSATDGKGVVIASGGATLSDAMSFEFSSNEAGSTFECRLDGGAFEVCTSVREYVGLAQGSHTIEVRATDAAGNTDPTPASFTWTVLTPAQATEQLADLVMACGLPQGIENGMLQSLDGAIQKLEDDNPNNDLAAIGKLEAFINKVEAQRGKRLSDEQADSLVAAATDIIAEVSVDLGL
jgi:hypothetical protein